MLVADTYTLEEAYGHLQDTATNAGRCPSCGRRHSDDEAKLFADMRDELATANALADRLGQQVESLKEERDQLKVRNADLRGQVKDLRAG
jgi:chromosome segregation ATPase